MDRFNSSLRRCIAVLLTIPAVSTFGAQTWTGAVSIDWNDPANWTNNTYPAGTDAIVNPNAGAFPNPTISALSPSVNDIRINDTAAGTAMVNQTGGEILQTGWFRIANVAGGTGIFNMSGGMNTITGARVHVGEVGTGVLNISGGTLRHTGNEGFLIGESPGSNGTVNQTGGTVIKTNTWLSIGGNGNGTYNISGGSLSAAGDFNIADVGVSTGVLNVSEANILTPTLVTSTGTLFVAKNAGTIGLLNVSGGTLNANLLAIGGADNSTTNGRSFATVSGGQVNASGELWVANGATSNGLMEVSAGVVSTNSWLAVGRRTGSYGVLNVSGTGTTRITAGDSRFYIVGSLGGTGTLNLLGGSMEAPNGGDLRLSENGGTGIANLIGGTLRTDRIADNGATSFLYMNGGTMQARISSATYLEGLDNAIVGPGGAIFDTNNNAITVNQLLAAPTGSGLASIPIVSGGSGYTAPPIVKITGGDGIGASAIAVLTGGVVTSIRITNPGIGYTTAPTVQLIDPVTTTAAVLDAPVLAANTPTGGLTKLGDGILTITVDNTYAGATNVNDGTLRFTSSQTRSSIVIADGAILELGAPPSAPDIAALPDFGPDAALVEGERRVTGVPEPSAVGLLLMGALGLLTRRRRR